MKVKPEEITNIQAALDTVGNWEIELFNMWETTKGDPKITIRLGKVKEK